MLAGGRSSRFGADKLAADLDGVPLLERAVSGLPPDAEVILVGPPRPVARVVQLVREDPPGGGPAAAMVAGLRAALARSPDAVLVLPADAPLGAVGALRLLARLRAEPAAEAVVAVDATGQEQPLQLALRPAAARALLAAAGPEGAAGSSARRLVAVLAERLRQPLRPEHSFDLDTPDQWRVWRVSRSPGVQRVLDALADRPAPCPVVVLPGPDPAADATLLSALGLRLGPPSPAPVLLQSPGDQASGQGVPARLTVGLDVPPGSVDVLLHAAELGNVDDA